MTLLYDQKEDLRLRMSYLQQKLTESEEERKKLEKTCNMLIKAFKDEERMHYKALNNKYEKFLEDCKIRRRRNDVILRSLCRVEDRARVLFARTERLKLLKDRYVSYLKPDSPKKNGVSFLNSPSEILKSSLVDDMTQKSVHWKTPQVADLIMESKDNELRNERDVPPNFDKERSCNVTNNSYRAISEKYNHDLVPAKRPNQTVSNLFDPDMKECQKDEGKKESKSTVKGNKMTTPITQNKKSFDIMKLDNSFTDRVSRQSNNHKEIVLDDERKDCNYSSQKRQDDTNVDFVSNDNNIDYLNDDLSSEIELELKDLKKVTELREKGVIKHQESIEKLKTALSMEQNIAATEKRDYLTEGTRDENIIEKDEIETNEKSLEKLKNDVFPRSIKKNSNNQVKMTSSPKHVLFSEIKVEKNKELENYDDLRVDDKGKSITNDEFSHNEYDFPKGLDGVDYQNETYPESYYEQPVHNHDYSNIASNVILEEDEEIEQEMSDYGSKIVLSWQSTESCDKTLAQDHVIGSNKYLSSHPPSEPYSDEHLQQNAIEESHKQNEGRALSGQSQSFLGTSCDQFISQDSESKIEDLSNHSKSQSKTQTSSKNITQTNLFHLLESDSESFQIEHGDVVSTHEDSDFDFSFH